MVNLKKIYTNILKESRASHLKHLFDDGTMTFDDFRNTFKNVFKGKVGISDKVKKIPLSITYKDGQYMLANDKNTFKEPFSVDKVCKKCKCEAEMKEAVTNTLQTFINALDKLDQKDRNSIFANGQNFYSIDLVLPPAQCIQDYHNRCFLQRNKVNCYDNTFNNVVEDDDNTNKLSEKLKLDKALEECGVEISQDCIDRLKGTMSPNKALEELLADLAKIVDGIGYKATVNDYVRERYARYIVNTALQKGIDLYANSDFVQELIARLSHISDHRPNRADLITYAKRGGIDFKCPEYRELIDQLEQNAEETNNQIMKPIEELVLKAGTLLIKCLLGMVVADPRKDARKLLAELDAMLLTLDQGDEGITPNKVHQFRKCMQKLNAYQATIPPEGILIMHNGKVRKICGTFGTINDIGRMMQL